MPRGQKRRLIAEVPLAEDRRGVAARLEDFGQRNFVRMQADRLHRLQHLPAAVVLVQAHAARIAASEQCGSRRRADAAGRVAACEPHAFAGQAVDMRRAMQPRAEAADIAVAEVVAENDDEVRRWIGGRERIRDEGERHRQE